MVIPGGHFRPPGAIGVDSGAGRHDRFGVAYSAVPRHETVAAVTFSQPRGDSWFHDVGKGGLDEKLIRWPVGKYTGLGETWNQQQDKDDDHGNDNQSFIRDKPASVCNTMAPPRAGSSAGRRLAVPYEAYG